MSELRVLTSIRSDHKGGNSIPADGYQFKKGRTRKVKSLNRGHDSVAAQVHEKQREGNCEFPQITFEPGQTARGFGCPTKTIPKWANVPRLSLR
jgi:hypothetical protein